MDTNERLKAICEEQEKSNVPMDASGLVNVDDIPLDPPEIDAEEYAKNLRRFCDKMRLLWPTIPIRTM